jgi:hypothetical protein
MIRRKSPFFEVPLSATSPEIRGAPKGVSHQALEKRFGETVLPFSDPDGMSLALVRVSDAANDSSARERNRLSSREVFDLL